MITPKRNTVRHQLYHYKYEKQLRYESQEIQDSLMPVPHSPQAPFESGTTAIFCLNSAFFAYSLSKVYTTQPRKITTRLAETRTDTRTTTACRPTTVQSH